MLAVTVVSVPQNLILVCTLASACCIVIIQNPINRPQGTTYYITTELYHSVSQMVAATLLELIELTKIAPNQWETVRNPERMGNTMPIAYGGCTLAAGINAACLSVGPHHHLYSAMGNYLGPALTDRKLQCVVRVIRDTKTFATRLVEVSQVQDNGSKRLCMTFLADFQRPEPATLLTYSKPTSMTAIPVEGLPTMEAYNQKLLDTGVITPEILKENDRMFPLFPRFFDILVTESVMAQNVKGLAKNVKTTQDHKPIYNKITADVFKLKSAAPATTHAEQMAAFAFMSDAALSFLPLSHNHMFMDDSGACASLDFALRLFRNDIDVNKWCRREAWTNVGAEGRTYSEWQFFDESGRNLIGSMTQQSILRSKPVKEGKGAKL